MSVLVLFSFIPYMVPTIIAAVRDLEDKSAIFWINLLLGWTVLGWIVALVWACTGARAVHRIEAVGDRVGPHGQVQLQGGDPRPDHNAVT